MSKDKFMPMAERTCLDAICQARDISRRTGRKHVVRRDYDRFFVVPLYVKGKEGREHDAGYAALGLLVGGSL